MKLSKIKFPYWAWRLKRRRGVSPITRLVRSELQIFRFISGSSKEGVVYDAIMAEPFGAFYIRKIPPKKLSYDTAKQFKDLARLGERTKKAMISKIFEYKEKIDV
jgi:hypothetical protein